MEEIRETLGKLSAKFDNSSFKGTLTELNDQMKKMDFDHSTSKGTLLDSIAQLTRKNKQLESEIERLQMLQNRNTSAFSKKNNERLKLSRRIIELEQENEDMETRLNRKENSLTVIEGKIKEMSYPSLDELYYEIVKGFGVEFVEKDGSTYARIKNKNKNDIFMIECDPNDLAGTCNQIWSSMK